MPRFASLNARAGALLSMSLLLLASPVESQVAFSNPTPITIADGVENVGPGLGDPYPSEIRVHGVPGFVSDVRVTIHDFSHSWPDDLGLILVAPDGTAMVIQSDVGGSTPVAAVTYTLGDAAATGIPDTGPLLPGTFRPSSVGDDDFFPTSGGAPPPLDCQPAGECPQAAPAGSATLAGTFGGLNPNGVWRLYAIDCCAQDTGSIGAGWSLEIGHSMFPGSVDRRVSGPEGSWSGEKPIPDNSETGVTIEIPVAGVTQSISDVTLELTANHTFIGDLEATLISPDGLARLSLFGRPGYKSGSLDGVSANLGGTYVFDDFAPQDLWAVLAPLGNGSRVPPGRFRSSTSSHVGPDFIARSGSGGCSTYLSGAFGGLAPDQANGTWKLHVADRGGADIGSITAVKLTINYHQGGDFIFGNGFEGSGSRIALSQAASPGSNQAPISGSGVLGDCTPAQFDFNGDGLSDFAFSSDEEGAIRWTVKENDLANTGQVTEFLFGTAATDFFFADDFDGDGIDDPVTWTPGEEGLFRIRRSSRPGDAPVEVRLGAETALVGTDPVQAGDYDGDRVADLAVVTFNSTAQPAGPVDLQYLPSSEGGNSVRTIVTGLSGNLFDFFISGGFDFTGDGRADVLTQTQSGNPSVGHWYIHDGATGALASEFDFQRSDDIIVPGNHVGNHQADVTASRFESIDAVPGRSYYHRDGQTGATSGPVRFGIAGDIRVTGDYDGDGLDDLAVWRPSTTPGESKFIIRRSTSPETPLEVLLGDCPTPGVDCDLPVANTRTK